MTGRLVWLGLGAAAGYLVLRRLGVVTTTPSGLAGKAATRVAGLAGAGAERGARNAASTVRDFADEVRARAAERETQLRAALAADVADPRSMDVDTARDLLEHPHSAR